jgi:hypothetical protein
MMEHDDVRAALELAAVEPGGLDRLAAGDTSQAAVLAGHLAGCPACMDELTRLRRADMLLRPVLAATAPPELRARTLAYVRTAGRRRGTSAEATPALAAPDAAAAPRIPVVTPRAARRAAWPAAVAAALVIGLGGGFLLAAGRAAPEAGDAAVAFTQVSRESAALLAAPDAARVVLADSAGVVRGSLIVAPAEGRMVAVAVDLPVPGAGREYRCWVEVNGSRTRLGTMWLTGSVAWWSGPAALPAGLGPGARFGVSLVAVGSGGLGEPVLSGGL